VIQASTTNRNRRLGVELKTNVSLQPQINDTQPPGEELWQKALKDHVLDPNKFNAYDPISLPKYDHTIDWLKEYAHTPQFGLVTHLPWDPQWVIESLSNSTIYFACYTIAQILQGKG